MMAGWLLLLPIRFEEMLQMIRNKPSVLAQSIIFAVFMIALIIFVYHFNIPNPNMILIAALVLSTSIGGTIPGLICALLMFGYSLFFFSIDHSFFHFTEVNLQKIVVITLGIVINFLSVAVLKKNRDRAGTQLQETNEELQKTNEELKKVNELLKSVASKDSLTNLRNRYSLRQDFEMYVGIPLHVMVLDLDDFKTINETKGHAFGDDALAKTGNALTDCFKGCHIYRYGNDEFLVIGENTPDKDFIADCTSVKKRLEESEISFSAGYVYGEPKEIPELRNMISQADEMLYEAKKTGKDQFQGKEFDRGYVAPTKADGNRAERRG